MSTFRFRSETGAEMLVDLSKMNLDPDRTRILEQIAKDSGPANLTREQWDRIKDIKASIGGIPDAEGPIVRFDWKWVRIDEPAIDFDELRNPGDQLT